MLKDIGFSYNPGKMDNIYNLDSVKGKSVEFQMWGGRPNEKHIMESMKLNLFGFNVNSVHLSTYNPYSYDFVEKITEDILFLQDYMPNLNSVVLHPPKRRGNREKMTHIFADSINRVASQVDVNINIENLRSSLIHSYRNAKEFSQILESGFLDNIGIVLDTTHIPITTDRKQNTENFLKFVESSGDKLNEVHISEPKFRENGRPHGHNAIDGSYLDWDKIFDSYDVPSYIEVINSDQVLDSYRYLYNKELGKLHY